MAPPDAARLIALVAATRAWGGVERGLVSLANAFVERGFAVDLVLVQNSVVPYPGSLDPRVRIVRLKNRHKLTGIPRLLKYCRRRQPLVLLAAKYHACLMTLWAKAWLGASPTVCVSVRNTLSLNLTSPARRRQVRLWYPRADRILAVSQGVADDLVEHFAIPGSLVTPIYNPVVDEATQPRAHAAIDHPWLSESPRREPIIIAAGRLVEQKDYPTLLEAFAELRRERGTGRLLVLGEGPERAKLTDQVARLALDQCVDLPGSVDDALPYIARAELFALSSLHEGLPNVLVEALAVGTPAVSTDCPSGPREVLQDGRLGCLVPPGDADALAKAMMHTLDAPPAREALQEAIAPFEADHSVDQYLRVMGVA